MFTRTQNKDVPQREEMDLEHAMCPPHDFDAAWASPPDAANHEDTVPGLYCRACGEVRAFKIQADAR